jgi:predicted RNA polymerase sigma factor
MKPANDPALMRYHLCDATLGEFYRRLGNLACARRHFELARKKTNSNFDREIIDRRKAQCI